MKSVRVLSACNLYIPSVLAPPAANAGINTNLVFGNSSTLLIVILLETCRKDLRGW